MVRGGCVREVVRASPPAGANRPPPFCWAAVHLRGPTALFAAESGSHHTTRSRRPITVWSLVALFHPSRQEAGSTVHKQKPDKGRVSTMGDLAEQVRQAQEAAAKKQRDRLAADERLRAEQAAAEAEITEAARQLARALRTRDVPLDVVVKHYESRIRIKRFGKQVREEATHHVLDGWLFGDTRHTFRDPESRYDRTETSLEGFILTEDGSVHHCHVSDIGSAGNARITAPFMFAEHATVAQLAEGCQRPGWWGKRCVGTWGLWPPLGLMWRWSCAITGRLHHVSDTGCLASRWVPRRQESSGVSPEAHCGNRILSSRVKTG